MEVTKKRGRGGEEGRGGRENRKERGAKRGSEKQIQKQIK